MLLLCGFNVSQCEEAAWLPQGCMRHTQHEICEEGDKKKAAAGRKRWRPNGGRSVLGNATVSTTNGSRNEKIQTELEQKREENISELGWKFEGGVGFMSTMLLSTW